LWITIGGCWFVSGTRLVFVVERIDNDGESLLEFVGSFGNVRCIGVGDA
jgi:hypothetical protein